MKDYRWACETVSKWRGLQLSEKFCSEHRAKVSQSTVVVFREYFKNIELSYASWFISIFSTRNTKDFWQYNEFSVCCIAKKRVRGKKFTSRYPLVGEYVSRYNFLCNIAFPALSISRYHFSWTRSTWVQATKHS